VKGKNICNKMSSPSLYSPIHWLLTVIITAHLPGCGSLKMMKLTVPPQLVFGQSASLQCNYDLEGSQLYSVKWYKNGQEFFRYMPSMDEQFTVFNIPGVHITHPTTGQPNYRSYNKINLNQVDLKTGGVFRCEVSNEFPDFHTVSQSVDLRVVAIPSGPVITPQPHTLAPGDRLEVNCTVRRSLPRPSLLWYINRVAVEEQGRREVAHTHQDGTTDLSSSISMILRRSHFVGGQVQLKCQAILEDFFYKSSELVVHREGYGREEGEQDEGKILGLFDDDSFRDSRGGADPNEQPDSVRTPWTSNSGEVSKSNPPTCLLILSLFLSYSLLLPSLLL